jgi:CheY-like chemotaxis protein
MNRKLLYIDPDVATRRLLRKALEPAGFTVLEAESAQEGQRSAERTRPDFILADVDVIKAAELVPVLRQSPGLESVPLLASTAHAWPEHIQKTLAWGFERVLLKPLDAGTLARELSSWGEAAPAAKADGAVERPTAVAAETPDAAKAAQAPPNLHEIRERAQRYVAETRELKTALDWLLEDDERLAQELGRSQRDCQNLRDENSRLREELERERHDKQQVLGALTKFAQDTLARYQ